MALIVVTIAIVVLFFIILLFKELLPNKAKNSVCALCGAVTITWFVLLVLFYLKLFDDKIILALLMGGSVVGFLYFVGKNVSDALKLFRLPFFVTLIMFAYAAIESSFDRVLLFVVGLLWLIFICISLHKNNKIIQKIIACCRDW